jgi:hypothetical protein
MSISGKLVLRVRCLKCDFMGVEGDCKRAAGAGDSVRVNLVDDGISCLHCSS